MVPDIAALIWIQSRMVFSIAAAMGYDPRDPMRPAELLVLYELYEDPAAARARSTAPASSWPTRSRRASSTAAAATTPSARSSRRWPCAAGRASSRAGSSPASRS
jgi:hypothetical protein